MKSEVRFLNGYRLVLLPNHPRAMKSRNWKGYVYEHIVIAEESIKRPMKDNEVVHHLNGDRGDNRVRNLLVLDKSQHGRLHAWINSGAIGLETFNKYRMNSKKAKYNEPAYCKICSKLLQDDRAKFCSMDCKGISSRVVERPTKNQLIQDINNMSFVKIGKKYGVSDNAVRKWAKQYEIISPTLSQALDTSKEGAETSGEVKSS